MDDLDNLSVITSELLLEEIKKLDKDNYDSRNFGSKVKILHTSILFSLIISKKKPSETCQKVLDNIGLKVGGTPLLWQDMGRLLKISQDKLYFIDCMKQENKVEIVLKVFMQDQDATLDKIIDVLIKLNRYDIVSAIKDDLCYIADIIDKQYRTDSGYQSNSSNPKKRKTLTIYDKLGCDLPKYLNKHGKPPTIKVLELLAEKDKNSSPILFLTFAQDGLQTAVNLQNFVAKWSDFPDVTLVTLEDLEESLRSSPEKIIRDYFEKADFIVPIITPNYLEVIKSYKVEEETSIIDNLDFKYVNFIYTLIVTNYVHASGCLNNKVRSVLPQVIDFSVVKNVTMYPELLPWTHESNFNEQFQAFLRRLYP